MSFIPALDLEDFLLDHGAPFESRVTEVRAPSNLVTSGAPVLLQEDVPSRLPSIVFVTIVAVQPPT